MKNILFLFTALTFASISGFAQNSDIKSILNTRSFSDSLQTNKALILLDVRTPEEFADGHLKNALNYDVKSTDFKSKIGDLDKAKTYYVYCRSGKRSATAVAEMRSEGFKTVYELEGGMLKWIADGMQTVKEVKE